MIFNKISNANRYSAIIFIALMYKHLTLLFIIVTCYNPLFAQQIKGVIQDREEKTPLANVELLNVYNNNTAHTDGAGNFMIKADRGELIEIRCAGYNVTRFRLSKGNVPSFFKLYLDKEVILNTDKYASSDLTQFQIDSIKSHELYRPALDYARMSTFEQMESPFTALSKSNKDKWRFQESYAMFEREKFIDFTFNEELVKKMTGLEGADLARYMKRYRPSYEALRNMSLYDYYTYIKQTAERFKKTSKPEHPRNSG